MISTKFISIGTADDQCRMLTIVFILMSGVYLVCWDQFHKGFMGSKLKFCKNCFCIILILMIITDHNFAYHNSWSVMACVTLWSQCIVIQDIFFAQNLDAVLIKPWYDVSQDQVALPQQSAVEIGWVTMLTYSSAWHTDRWDQHGNSLSPEDWVEIFNLIMMNLFCWILRYESGHGGASVLLLGFATSWYQTQVSDPTHIFTFSKISQQRFDAGNLNHSLWKIRTYVSQYHNNREITPGWMPQDFKRWLKVVRQQVIIWSKVG